MSQRLPINKFSEQEKKFLSKIDPEDYVPLNDVVRIFSGYDRWATEEDYLNALEFIKYLMNKYQDKFKCLEGPEPHQLNMTAEEFTEWLKEMWYAGKYKEIDYGIWFDLELEEEK